LTLPGWPALRGCAAPPWGLGCEHGVWGKVQAGPADFRWVARSPGFGDDDLRLARALRIGAENHPSRLTAWRVHNGQYLALAYYPSRGQDAAGRSGFLERQVLAWRPCAGILPALAALALLPAVARVDDRIWRDRQHLGRWSDLAYSLPLEALELGELGPDQLTAVIRQGVDELAARIPPQALRDLYAQVLTGARPARLALTDGALGPAALAALLLPLPPQTAGRLSLAGWIPDLSPDPTDLAANWNLTVTRPGPNWRQPTPTDSEMERAERLAAALSANDPLLLTEAGPPPPATMPVAPPGGKPHGVVTVLAAFAANHDYRLLDLAELARASSRAPYPLPMPDGPGGHPLCRWVAQLATGRPDWADEVSWGQKVDQLRSASLCLLPHPETLALVGLPESPWVPALLVALACAPSRIGPALGEHGEAGLSRIFSQSLACPRPVVRSRVWKWLKQWSQAVGTGSRLGRIAADCLGRSKDPDPPGDQSAPAKP